MKAADGYTRLADWHTTFDCLCSRVCSQGITVRRLEKIPQRVGDGYHEHCTRILCRYNNLYRKT